MKLSNFYVFKLKVKDKKTILLGEHIGKGKELVCRERKGE
jgi:hypothetical protein